MPATAPVDEQILSAGVLPGSVWTSITVLAATGSTHADLTAAAREGAPHGAVLITDNQTAGRGRLSRSWTTPPGTAVACSVLVRPQGVGLGRWPWLSLMTGVGLVDGLRAVSGVRVGLKWPNDVVVPGERTACAEAPAGGDRKLCGLLAERVDTPTGPAAVLGFGINVSLDRSELPVPAATSLLLEGAEIDKTAVMIAVLRELARAYLMWRDDPSALAVAYAGRCVTIGRDVRVHLGERGDVTGRAVGIDATGGLRVRTAAGERVFAAGDVVHLRLRDARLRSLLSQRKPSPADGP